jgi:hypothetical protein
MQAQTPRHKASSQKKSEGNKYRQLVAICVCFWASTRFKNARTR